jgi:predicted transcriptional regulator
MLNNPDLDRWLAALGDRSRRHMVEFLAMRPCRLTRLARAAEISVPLALHHLAILQEAGLVRTEKQGHSRIFFIEDGALRALLRWTADQGTALDVQFRPAGAEWLPSSKALGGGG